MTALVFAPALVHKIYSNKTQTEMHVVCEFSIHEMYRGVHQA